MQEHVICHDKIYNILLSKHKEEFLIILVNNNTNNPDFLDAILENKRSLFNLKKAEKEQTQTNVTFEMTEAEQLARYIVLKFNEHLIKIPPELIRIVIK